MEPSSKDTAVPDAKLVHHQTAKAASWANTANHARTGLDVGVARLAICTGAAFKKLLAEENTTETFGN